MPGCRSAHERVAVPGASSDAVLVSPPVQPYSTSTHTERATESLPAPRSVIGTESVAEWKSFVSVTDPITGAP